MTHNDASAIPRFEFTKNTILKPRLALFYQGLLEHFSNWGGLCCYNHFFRVCKIYGNYFRQTIKGSILFKATTSVS